MKPYYADESVTLYHGDCREVLAEHPLRCQAVITDPPYNIGKAEWDRIDDYLAWSRGWIDASSAGLDLPGAFWCFHSDPLILSDIARMISDHRKRSLVSWITLDKSSWGIAKRYANAGSKSFPASVEYATYSRCEVYAGQIQELRTRLGMTRAEFDTLVSPSRKPTGITYRWEQGERIPQPMEVERIRDLFGISVTVPTFNNPSKIQSVWQFPQTDTTDHPTPKPSSIVSRMIAVTTNPGDTILDPFAGSGTTLRAAKDEGRKAVGVELDERYCEVIAKRLAQDVLDFGGVA